MREEEIDAEALLHLSAAHLEELGVSSENRSLLHSEHQFGILGTRGNTNLEHHFWYLRYLREHQVTASGIKRGSSGRRRLSDCARACDSKIVRHSVGQLRSGRMGEGVEGGGGDGGKERDTLSLALSHSLSICNVHICIDVDICTFTYVHAVYMHV